MNYEVLFYYLNRLLRTGGFSLETVEPDLYSLVSIYRLGTGSTGERSAPVNLSSYESGKNFYFYRLIKDLLDLTPDLSEVIQRPKDLDSLELPKKLAADLIASHFRKLLDSQLPSGFKSICVATGESEMLCCIVLTDKGKSRIIKDKVFDPFSVSVDSIMLWCSKNVFSYYHKEISNQLAMCKTLLDQLSYLLRD